MDTIHLRAQPRTVLGKKVRFLRRQGVIPVNVFGHNIPSAALQADRRKLEEVLARAGMNALISLDTGQPDGARPVLVRGLQRKATTGELLHVDLYQVSMTEKIRTEVPLVFTGEAPGVTAGGILLENLDRVEIECLPSDLVPSIEVDITSLAEIDQAILVKDLKVGQGIVIVSHPDTVVVKVMPPEKEEVEVAEVAPAAEAAAPEEEAAAAEETTE